MSLVGSLEDLGLGDILQIIHLSRKSGTLWIRSSAGEGQIVFSAGLICGAFTKDGPADLRDLLLAGGSIARPDLEAASEEAALARGRARGDPLGARDPGRRSVRRAAPRPRREVRRPHVHLDDG